MRLYHNPRCSKSRKALELLQQRGIEFETYLYLKEGIAKEDIETLASLEGIIRKNDLDKPKGFELNNKELIINLLEKEPKLMQRPVLIENGNAIIGRPPEDILALLD